ncbi:hypothetical protein ABZ614_41730 [Streptomyces sp. NPDC013178]|uniref:hypothetical protein n=1 Tax=Streptomyces sp. NPDC013178 TaxID=3155118 RepID=UPI0033FE321B
MKRAKWVAAIATTSAVAFSLLTAGTASAVPPNGVLKLCADGNYRVKVELPMMGSPFVEPGTCRSWQVPTGGSSKPVSVIGKFNTSDKTFFIDQYYFSERWYGLGIHAVGTTANGGRGADTWTEK